MSKLKAWIALSAGILSLASCAPSTSVTTSGSESGSSNPPSSQGTSSSSSTTSSSSEASSESSSGGEESSSQEPTSESLVTSGESTSGSSSGESISLPLPPGFDNQPIGQGTFEANGYELKLVGDAGVTVAKEFADPITGDARVVITVKTGERLKNLSIVGEDGTEIPFNWSTDSGQPTFPLEYATANAVTRASFKVTQNITVTASTYQRKADVPDAAYAALAALAQTKSGAWEWSAVVSEYGDFSNVLSQKSVLVYQDSDPENGYVVHAVDGTADAYWEPRQPETNPLNLNYVGRPYLKADGTTGNNFYQSVWGIPYDWAKLDYGGYTGVGGWGLNPLAPLALDRDGSLATGDALLAELKASWIPIADPDDPDAIVFVDATVEGEATLSRAASMIDDTYGSEKSIYVSYLDATRGTGLIKVKKSESGYGLAGLTFAIPSYLVVDQTASMAYSQPVLTQYQLTAFGEVPERAQIRDLLGFGYLNALPEADATVLSEWKKREAVIASLAKGNFTVKVETTGVLDGGLPEGLSGNGWGPYQGTIWSDLDDAKDPWAATDLAAYLTGSNDDGTSLVTRTTGTVAVPDVNGKGLRSFLGYAINGKKDLFDLTNDGYDVYDQTVSDFAPHLESLKPNFIDEVSKDGKTFTVHPDKDYALSQTLFSQSLLKLVTSPLDLAFGQPASDATDNYGSFSLNCNVSELSITFEDNGDVVIHFTASISTDSGETFAATETLTYTDIGTTEITDANSLSLKADAEAYLKAESSGGDSSAGTESQAKEGQSLSTLAIPGERRKA